jgi:GNAT superfamily N-acetyltransferase
MTDARVPPFRRLREDDDLGALTDLLHRAYAPLAARGLRYVATHQDVETTRKRATGGECWVGDDGGSLVATVTWYRPFAGSYCAWYRRPDVAFFGQFAVDPALQGRGVGGALLALVERRAAEEGYAELACDTASPADDLIAFYRRRGFRQVGTTRWTSVNYESVVLSKTLGT